MVNITNVLATYCKQNDKKMPEPKFRHTNQNKCAINQILFKNDSIILLLALFIDLSNCTFIVILFAITVQE